MLKSGWMGGEIAEKSIVRWVAELKKKLQATAAIVDHKELEEKARIKKSYDKRATLISFKPGDMVLMWKPQLQANLQDTWDGPFEVLCQVLPVKYVIAVPNHRKHKKTVHVNMLKHWTTPDASVLSVLLLHDEEDEEIVSAVKDDEHPLTEQQRHQLNQTLLQWEKTLNSEPGKVSTTVHVINTGSSSPTIVPQYWIVPACKEPLRDELRFNAKTGIIRPSLSPWSSPVLPVKRKDGTIRVCVDFHILNAATIPNPYEMPRIDDIIDQLGEAKNLSKLDLSKGFYQIPVNPDNVEKTAFRTPIGKFEFLAMPFGLRNAPATFQRLMDILLGDTPEFACAYMGDVIIFSNSWDDHLQHINIVMSKLAESCLTAKPLGKGTSCLPWT